jgi:hypothetical protein
MVIVFGVLWLVGTLVQLLGAALRSRSALAAENLFLRRQLALYRERNVKARRPDRLTRFAVAYLARLFDWRSALVIVRPRTLIAGITPAFVCSGDGNQSRAARRYQSSCAG